MKALIAYCAVAMLAAGCSQQFVDDVNATFGPLDRAWNAYTEENPFLGFQIGLDSVIVAEQIREIKRLEKAWR